MVWKQQQLYNTESKYFKIVPFLFVFLEKGLMLKVKLWHIVVYMKEGLHAVLNKQNNIQLFLTQVDYVTYV